MLRTSGILGNFRRIIRIWLLLGIGMVVIPGADLWAQVTTASLRGTVLDSEGKPADAARVTLEFPASQIKKEATTGSDGVFAFTGLRVGGPYRLEAAKSGTQNAKREAINLTAGNNEAIVLDLGQVETMQIVGTRNARTSQKNTFFASDIAKIPAPSQDLREIVKQSPDAVFDGGKLSIGGANNRFNSITIDGMRQDDSFGLNGNGYPTQRSPISLMSVQEISLEKSPFDVRYGNFLGGNINVVTKSGTNEFEGAVMITRSTDGLQGNKTKHTTVKSTFEENRLGFALGGPIIKDKLHFFLNVEGLDSTKPSTAGPLGSGKPIIAERIQGNDVARVQEISNRVYGFDAGKYAQSLKEEDRKALLKLDYKINDAHRLEAKYQYASGNNINDSFASNTTLPLTSNWYDKRDTMNTSSLRLYSDWTESLSTKFEASTKNVKTEQNPLNGNGFMQAEIKNSASALPAAIAQAGTIIIGPDRSRHANELRNTTNAFGGEVNYLAGSHLVTSGVQLETTDVFNLFIQDANGRGFYDTIDAFEAKTPSRLNYQNAISNNKDDAAANWSYGITTVYLQDEWQMTPALILRGGLRTEFYDASGKIDRNQIFIQRYGYSNTSDLSGRQAVLPRLGLSYKAAPKLNIRGGLGLFSGGTPNVWVSNTYTNDGVSVDDVSTNTAAQINGFDGRNIPAAVSSQLVAGDGNVDVMDPNFKIPQSYKFQAGLDYKFDIPSVADNIGLELNYSFTKTRYGVMWKDLRRNNSSFGAGNVATTVGPDGRLIYDTTPGATATGEFNPNRGYDLLLTNTDKGYAHNASASLSKNFNTGFNVRGFYAWQDVQEVSPATSSTSGSNYSNMPVKLDPNDVQANRSIYERKHRFLLSAGYENNFWSDLASSIDFIFERRSGQPYSFTMGGDRNALARLYGESSAFSGANRELFYVPKGDGSDVILETDSAKGAIDPVAFNAFIKKHHLEKYRGQIAPRNAFFSDWVQELNLRMSQQLPTYKDTGKARLVLDILNLPNLLNKNWGQTKQANFPYMTTVSNVSYDAPSNRYVYSNLRSTDVQSVRVLDSVWKMQLAAYYDF